MRFKIISGFLELEPDNEALRGISDSLKKIAEGDFKAEEKRLNDTIFKPSGEINLKRKGNPEVMV